MPSVDQPSSRRLRRWKTGVELILPFTRTYASNNLFNSISTKWHIGYAGGGFVQAVVDNDLQRAFANADNVNVKALKFYCQLILLLIKSLHFYLKI